MQTSEWRRVIRGLPDPSAFVEMRYSVESGRADPWPAIDLWKLSEDGAPRHIQARPKLRLRPAIPLGAQGEFPATVGLTWRFWCIHRAQEHRIWFHPTEDHCRDETAAGFDHKEAGHHWYFEVLAHGWCGSERAAREAFVGACRRRLKALARQQSGLEATLASVLGATQPALITEKEVRHERHFSYPSTGR